VNYFTASHSTGVIVGL